MMRTLKEKEEFSCIPQQPGVRCTFSLENTLYLSLLIAPWKRGRCWLHLQVWQPRPGKQPAQGHRASHCLRKRQTQVTLSSRFFSSACISWLVPWLPSLPSSQICPRSSLHLSGPAQSLVEKRPTYTYSLKGRLPSRATLQPTAYTRVHGIFAEDTR